MKKRGEVSLFKKGIDVMGVGADVIGGWGCQVDFGKGKVKRNGEEKKEK